MPTSRPRMLAQQLGAGTDHLDAGEADRAANACRRWQQAACRQRRDALAGAGFADDAQHLVRADIEIDAAHRRHRRPVPVKSTSRPRTCRTGSAIAGYRHDGWRAAGALAATTARFSACSTCNGDRARHEHVVDVRREAADVGGSDDQADVEGVGRDAEGGSDQDLVQVVVGGLDLIGRAQRRVDPLDRRDVVGVRMRLAEDRVVRRSDRCCWWRCGSETSGCCRCRRRSPCSRRRASRR